MKKRIQECVVGLVFLVASTEASAGALRKVWELNVNDVIKETGESSALNRTVFALRFSPNGERIAVVVKKQAATRTQAAKNYLLVLTRESPAASVQQFEIAGGVYDAETPNSWSGFDWTASGDAIVAGGEVLQLANRRACGLSPIGDGTIGSRLSLGEQYRSEGRPPRFLIFDATCQGGEHWDLPKDGTIADVSVIRRLVAVSRLDEIHHVFTEALVVNPLDGKVVQRWPGNVTGGSDLRFADQGRAICSGKNADAPGRIPVRCWDVDSGKQIAEAATANGGAPIAAATQSTRIVASDYRYQKLLWDEDGKEVLTGRVVFDFKTGKEIASWKPDLQPYDVGIQPVKKQPFVFTISPDGQYIAEGGNGIVRLYKIEATN